MSKVKQTRRPKLTEREKEYIYNTLLNAKNNNLDLKAVMHSLADELGSSWQTMRNVWSRMRKEDKTRNEAEKPKPKQNQEQLNLVGIEESSLLSKNERKEAQKFLKELVTSVENNVSGLEIVGTGLNELKAESEEIQRNLNKENNQLLGVLLDRLEKTIQEREDWKRKYYEISAENEKIKARVIKEFLS